MTLEILSFGHGTADQGTITELLQDAGVKTLLDVRTAPGSKRNPHVNRNSLRMWLPLAGIEYQWMPELGGFRKHTDECDKDIVWRNKSFKHYAGYTRSLEFVLGMERLVQKAEQSKTAFMCSETVWWRCHRRIISDYLTCSLGIRVNHLMHDGKLVPHVPTEGLRVVEEPYKVSKIVYDGATPPEQSLAKMDAVRNELYKQNKVIIT